MARSKRKRASIESKSSKKRQKSNAAHETYDPEQLWEIRDIIDENKTKYLIDWKDNPITGESYKPTWEPKAHANREAIADWERRKGSEAETRSAQSVKPKSQSDARAAVGQQTSGIERFPIPKPAQRIDTYQTIGRRRTYKEASVDRNSAYNLQETHFGRFPPEQEIQDSLEQNEIIYSSQPSSVIVLILPRDDIDKSKYLEYPESNAPERVVRSSTARAEFTIPDSTASSSRSSGSVSQLRGRGRVHVPTTSPVNIGISHSSRSIINTVNSLSGSPITTGGHFSSESVKVVQASSAQGATENTVGKTDSTNQTDSWLTASCPILTAPIASGPQEGSSAPNRSLHSVQEESTCPRSGERLVSLSTSGKAPSTEPPRSSFSVSDLSHPNLTNSSSNPGSQEKTIASQKSTTIPDRPLIRGQSTLVNNSVSDTSAAFQTQIPVVNSVETANNSITQHDSIGTSETQQAAQVDPLAIYRLIPQLTSSQEQARDSKQSTTTGTTALSRAVELPLPVEVTPEHSRSVEKRQRPSENTSVGNTCESRILQSIEVDTVTNPLDSEDQHLTLSSFASPSSFLSVEQGGASSLSPRLRTDAGMSDSPSSQMHQSEPSLKERLRTMRAEHAEARASRSPSVIPSRPPTSVSESNHKPGSGQVLGLIAKQPTNRAGPEPPVIAAGLAQGARSISLRKPLLGQSEFIVALPMSEEIRRQYEQVIYNNRESIESFTRAEKPDETMKEEMKKLVTMLKRVEDLTTHADLAKSTSPEPMKASKETEVKWAKFCSAKFNFLGHLLDAMGKSSTHIAILAEAQPLLDLLEKFLRAMKIKFHRPDNRAKSPVRLETPCDVTLLPTGRRGTPYVVSNATAVIIMDGSFNPNHDHVRSFRSHLVWEDQLAPAIHLVIPNSTEHIIRCLPKDIDDPVLRQKLLISFVAQARHEAGKLPAGYPSPAEAAKKVAQFLLKTRDKWDDGDLDSGNPNADEEEEDTSPVWPLPLLGEVAGISELMDSQVSGGSVLSSQTHDGSIQVQSEQTQSQKRGLDLTVDEDRGSPKKQRLTPAPTERSLPVNMEVMNEVVGIEQGVPVETGNSETEAIAQLHARLEEQKQIEVQLRQTVSRLEEQLREYGKALNEARDEVEQQMRDSQALRKERDAIAAAMMQSEERRKAQSAEINKLKEDRTRLESEVRQTREAMLNSDVPEKVEWARLQEEKQRGQEEIGRLQKKLELIQQDFEFTREQYQNASTAAVEASSEVETLRKRNEELEKEAGAERVKLRQALEKREEDEKQKKGEIRRLKLQLEEQEQAMRAMMGAIRI